MKQITRKRALALCICILFILFASSLSVIHDSDHHCAGEDCPVCAYIRMVLHLVRGLSQIGLFLAALSVYPKTASFLCICIDSCRPSLYTGQSESPAERLTEYPHKAYLCFPHRQTGSPPACHRQTHSGEK